MNRTATRPEPTVQNARFGDVRADEVRVRDIVSFTDWNGTTAEVIITSTTWVGDDVQFVGRVSSESGWREIRFETSESNGVRVVGRA